MNNAVTPCKLGLACCMWIAASAASAVDVWDATGGDGSSGTDNELIHGTEQVHDLQAQAGIADEDWFRVGQAPHSSYEVIVDGLTEPVANVQVVAVGDELQLELVTGTGIQVAASSGISPIGSSRSLRFRNTTAGPVNNQFVRVRTGSGGCMDTCTSLAQYRIKFRETTLMIPRFNNSGTQVTVLLMQNGSRDTVNATARFWSPSGTLLASQPFSMPSRGGFVLNTSTVSGATGASGFMTVDHDGRFGEVTGKSVALEPATGFSFDTPAVPRLF